MHLAHYLGLLHRSERNLAGAYRQVARAHRDEPDVRHLCERLAQQYDAHVAALQPYAQRYARGAAPSGCSATCTTST